MIRSFSLAVCTAVLAVAAGVPAHSQTEKAGHSASAAPASAQAAPAPATPAPARDSRPEPRTSFPESSSPFAEVKPAEAKDPENAGPPEDDAASGPRKPILGHEPKTQEQIKDTPEKTEKVSTEPAADAKEPAAEKKIHPARQMPAITWAGPRRLEPGQALANVTFNVTANVLGRFAYIPGCVFMPQQGSCTVTATFTPADPEHYESATATKVFFTR